MRILIEIEKARPFEKTVLGLLIFMCILLAVQNLFAAEGEYRWMATWNANADSEKVVGYKVFYAEKSALMVFNETDVGNVLGYSFLSSDSVCAFVTAYDSSGNISLPSVVVCEKVETEEPPPPVEISGDINKDGIIDMWDLLLFNYFFSTPEVYNAKIDFSPPGYANGVIDIFDKIAYMTIFSEAILQSNE